MKTVEREVSEFYWECYCISSYKPVEDCVYYKREDWAVCPVCGVRPRILVFDNGRYAKCLCSERYGPCEAEAESIAEYARRNNNNLTDYDGAGLMKAWNIRCARLQEVQADHDGRGKGVGR